MIRKRHLQPVPADIAVELVREPTGLPSETEAREIHRKVAAELACLTDVGLIQRARQVAQDFKAPSRHKGLTHAEWCCLMVRMVGDVADQIAGVTLIGGHRPARQARAAIERAIGLLLVLDDNLREAEDSDAHKPA
jgi:hypothetical protein